jgi:hypothetical protein
MKIDSNIDEEDLEEQSTEDTFLSGSPSGSLCQPELFQDSGTKITNCRQPLVSFNDIVDYLSISTDDNCSFEDSKCEDLQTMFCQYRRDFPNGQGDSDQSNVHVKSELEVNRVCEEENESHETSVEASKV